MIGVREDELLPRLCVICNLYKHQKKQQSNSYKTNFTGIFEQKRHFGAVRKIRTLSASRKSTPLRAALVATATYPGVSMIPWGVWIRPTLA